MEYITLRNSDLRVSRLCVGGCPMGGHGWGEVSKNDLIRSVHRALDSGINFFDTADIYGLGEAESILGEALRSRRQEAVIASKFGVRRGTKGVTYYDNSPEWISEAVEASLNRLNTDYIDLLQLHYRDNRTPIDVVIDALERLKNKGLIRHYGLSNIDCSDLDELKQANGAFISFQNEYSLANRKHEEDIKRLSEELNLSVLTWGSLGQGILSGKYDENSFFSSNDRRSRNSYINFHGEKLTHNLKIVSIMREVSARSDKSLPAIAIRWILDRMPASVVIVGVKTPEQMDMNATSLGWSLEYDDLTILEEISRYGGEKHEQLGTCLEN